MHHHQHHHHHHEISSKKARPKTHGLFRAVGRLIIYLCYRDRFHSLPYLFEGKINESASEFIQAKLQSTATAILIQSNRRMDVAVVLVQHGSHSPTRQNKTSVDQPGRLGQDSRLLVEPYIDMFHGDPHPIDIAFMCLKTMG